LDIHFLKLLKTKRLLQSVSKGNKNQEIDSSHPTITTFTKDSDQVFIFITFLDSVVHPDF